ncbi:MAG: ISL3 family transposase [Alphaproteobacteria bacterium]|nr:ISL3 family transposase [Alphaproteobacteria bacterium]
MIDLLAFMTVQDVSELFKISWGTVKSIDKEYLQKHYSKPVLKNVEFIAIDEFAFQKGHKYQTVVYDLKAGRVIYVGQGRAEESLDKFWKRLCHSGAKIQAVAMDMWLPYFNAVINNIPEAKIVFDRFHIFKLMNETMDEIRRALYHEETFLNKRSVIKGIRWLLLKSNKNLNDEKNERKQLEQALQINQPLAEAYYLKEELGLLWSKNTRDEAEEFLTSWATRAWATTIQPLRQFVKTLLGHRTGILNWFDFRISTGPLEGFILKANRFAINHA